MTTLDETCKVFQLPLLKKKINYFAAYGDDVEYLLRYSTFRYKVPYTIPEPKKMDKLGDPKDTVIFVNLEHHNFGRYPRETVAAFKAWADAHGATVVVAQDPKRRKTQKSTAFCDIASAHFKLKPLGRGRFEIIPIHPQGD